MRIKHGLFNLLQNHSLNRYNLSATEQKNAYTSLLVYFKTLMNLLCIINTPGKLKTKKKETESL